jgi:hypothetical protein
MVNLWLKGWMAIKLIRPNFKSRRFVAPQRKPFTNSSYPAKLGIGELTHFFLSGVIYSYALLEKGCYYLIQEKEQGPVGLIRVNMETDHCMYVSSYAESELTIWKKKTDPIFDILELLEDDKVKTWESIYNDSQDTYNYEEDEE